MHERSVESDFLLMVLRDTLRERRRDLRVVLMSATLDEDLFSSYFAAPPAPPPPPLALAQPTMPDGTPAAPIFNANGQMVTAGGAPPMPPGSAPTGGASGGICAGEIAPPTSASCTSLASLASSSSAGPSTLASTVVPSGPLLPAPCIRVPGRTYPVTTFFLEDAMQLTRHHVRHAGGPTPPSRPPT